jgi:hypothetical protein
MKTLQDRRAFHWWESGIIPTSAERQLFRCHISRGCIVLWLPRRKVERGGIIRCGPDLRQHIQGSWHVWTRALNRIARGRQNRRRRSGHRHFPIWYIIRSRSAMCTYRSITCINRRTAKFHVSSLRICGWRLYDLRGNLQTIFESLLFSSAPRDVLFARPATFFRAIFVTGVEDSMCLPGYPRPLLVFLPNFVFLLTP